MKYAELNNIWFALLYSIMTLLLYHGPLFSFAAANLDYQSLSGIITLLELAIAQVVVVFYL